MCDAMHSQDYVKYSGPNMQDLGIVADFGATRGKSDDGMVEDVRQAAPTCSFELC